MENVKPATALAEIAHHYDVGLALAAGEGELLAVRGPAKREHLAARKFAQLHGRAPGKRLFPDVRCPITRQQESNGLVVGGELNKLHPVRGVEGVQNRVAVIGGRNKQP